MNLSKKERIDCLVVSINGTFDIQEVSTFEEFMNKSIKNFLNVAFDFTNVDFIDSSGIGALVKILSLLKKRKGKVYVFNLNTQISSIFSAAKLNAFLNVVQEKEIDRLFPEDDEVADIMKRL